MKMAAPPEAQGELDALALEKLESILGAERAQALFQEMLAIRGIAHLTSAQDLYDFSQDLTKRGGFEGAVGAMLGVAAIIRGAKPADGL